MHSTPRIIPAHMVHEIEQIAALTDSAAQRVQHAEARCLAGLASTLHAAWKRGFALGHAEAVKQLCSYFDALHARRKSIDADLIAFVMEAVNKIVRGLPPDLVTGSLVQAALDEVQAERGRLVLRVHPTRAEAARTWLGEQPTFADGPLRVMVEADATMNADDCMLETPGGLIDAGLPTQFAALNALLNEEATS